MRFLGMIVIAFLLPVAAAEEAKVKVWVDGPIDEICIPFVMCLGECVPTCVSEQMTLGPVTVDVTVLP